MLVVVRRGWFALFVLVAVVAGVPPVAGAQSDPEAERREAQQRRAAVSAELDTLTATEAELAQADRALRASIAAQQGELGAARSAVAAAEEQVVAAEAELAAGVAAIAELKALVVERAVSEFKNPPSFDLDAFLRSSDIAQVARNRSLLGAVSGNDADVVAQLREAEEDLVAQRAQTERAAAAAAARRDEVATTLTDLEDSRAQQAEVKAALDERIQDFRREADQLSAQEEELTRIIAERAAEQRRLEEERLAAQRTAAKSAADRAAAERRRSAPPARGGEPAPAPAPTPRQESAPSSSGARLIWPTSGRVTSEFGTRWGRQHAGIDIGAPTGTAIRAGADGTVFFTGWMSGYGHTVIIDHGGGFTTLYAHQSSIVARNGTRVSQGQLIGYVGNTGRSTGPHLHLETRVNGAARNPRNYLP
ncbi:MAG TPA: peptidoglycan DD-metalloendopeptidase family protein [Acidimicrobiales bacterium]|nr:peptidoglycan DD-metalloendopeptidase family protein [Acidimicrobiales bacterium]